MNPMSRKDKQPKSPPEKAPPAEPADALAAEPVATAREEALRSERDDLLGRLQRVSADYLNYQKRAQRDIEQAREFANETLIKNLLAVLDDMERALEAARANHDEDDPLLTGMQMVHDKAVETLGKFGLTLIDAAGQPFDPELHAAMLQQPSADCPPQTVLQEVVRGYRLKGRTIRPSSVIVSKAPDGEPADAPPQEQ